MPKHQTSSHSTCAVLSSYTQGVEHSMCNQYYLLIEPDPNELASGMNSNLFHLAKRMIPRKSATDAAMLPYVTQRNAACGTRLNQYTDYSTGGVQNSNTHMAFFISILCVHAKDATCIEGMPASVSETLQDGNHSACWHTQQYGVMP